MGVIIYFSFSSKVDIPQFLSGTFKIGHCLAYVAQSFLLFVCFSDFNLPKTFSADYSLDGKKWVQVAQRISRSEEAMCRWEVVSNDPQECAKYNGYVKEITDKYVKAGWAHY